MDRKICQHCEGDGREPKERGRVAGIWMVIRYFNKRCTRCGGSGEDRSVSVDELREKGAQKK